MEKNKIDNKKKVLLLVYMCIGWFIPYIYSFIMFYQSEKRIQSVIIIITFIVTTVIYYISKNRILRLLVMISAIILITVVIGYGYMLTVYTAFAVMYVYKSSDTKDVKNEKINGALLVLAPFTAIVGLLINFEAIIRIEAEIVVFLIVFEIIFLILMKCSGGKKSNKKTKKTNKNKEQGKNFAELRKTVFSVSIIGVLSSTVSYAINNAVIFFPWFLFIALLIYEEDESLYSASGMIVNKIKAFVE